MTGLISQLDSFVTPVNERFVWLLEESELVKAKGGRIPDISRALSVQCAKKDIPTFFTKSDFTRLKKMVREQNVELLKSVEKQMPGYLEKVNKGLEKEFDWQGSPGISGYIPAAGPEETERTLSYPMLVKYSISQPDGRQTFGTSAITVTFLHLKGKIIFLHCNGAGNDLRWARNVSKAWASEIVAANPSDGAIDARESAGGAPMYVIVVGVIAVVWSIVKWFKKRK